MRKGNLIYLDYNSTTPVDPRVMEAMVPFFTDMPGNASSRSHPFGWQAESAIQQSTQHLAELLSVDHREIVYTSGATESVNLAIKGVYEKYHRQGDHIITLATEHSAVLDTCEYIERRGGNVTYLSTDHSGMIDMDQLSDAITDKTILVAIMWANNETGVIQPMEAIGKLCSDRGVLLFSDATQAVGKIPVHPREMGIHLLAFSGHKMYGPKGTGGLYISRSNPRIKLSAQIHGGNHQGGVRSGTLNVTGIVGLGEAAKIAHSEMAAEADRLSALRDHVDQQLLAIDDAYINGHPTERLPHVTNIGIRHVEGEALMATVNQDIAISSGSACTSASMEPSHVLVGMGYTDARAHDSIRISLGRYSDQAQVDIACKRFLEGIDRLRKESPAWMLYQDGHKISW